ncbi:hypothetical protein D3C72_2380160 [compost metagenome]
MRKQPAVNEPGLDQPDAGGYAQPADQFEAGNHRGIELFAGDLVTGYAHGRKRCGHD